MFIPYFTHLFAARCAEKYVDLSSQKQELIYSFHQVYNMIQALELKASYFIILKYEL